MILQRGMRKCFVLGAVLELLASDFDLLRKTFQLRVANTSEECTDTIYISQMGDLTYNFRQLSDYD
ncbi:MAG: hypothetical protein ACI86M_001655 [Saprospiraceae bacterium]|jgi:hypothetical protein